MSWAAVAFSVARWSRSINLTSDAPAGAEPFGCESAGASGAVALGRSAERSGERSGAVARPGAAPADGFDAAEPPFPAA